MRMGGERGIKAKIQNRRISSLDLMTFEHCAVFLLTGTSNSVFQFEVGQIGPEKRFYPVLDFVSFV